MMSPSSAELSPRRTAPEGGKVGPVWAVAPATASATPSGTTRLHAREVHRARWLLIGSSLELAGVIENGPEEALGPHQLAQSNQVLASGTAFARNDHDPIQVLRENEEVVRQQHGR